MASTLTLDRPASLYGRHADVSEKDFSAKRVCETKRAAPAALTAAALIFAYTSHYSATVNVTTPSVWGSADSAVEHDNVGTSDRNALLSAEIISYRELRDGWEGDDSVAPARQAINEALAFIDLIPIGSAVPEPMVAADGEVGFYWNTGGAYIDVSFRGTGQLSYYAKAGAFVAKDRLSTAGLKALPKDLLFAIEAA